MPMTPWSNAGVWVGDGLRREVFFFRSRDVDLYGSLFVSAEPSRPFGVVACGSWGVEADRSDALLRSVALAMARLGGAGLVFHYPGYGDSFGDLDEVDLPDLTEAAGDAVAEAARRCPDMTWILAGFMFGASIACLGQRQSAAAQLLLVQPSLRPGSYFRWLADRPRPLALGAPGAETMEAGGAPGMAYGYPVPRRILARAADADAEVQAALAAFQGEATIVEHEGAEVPGLELERFQRVVVPGRWRFGSRKNPRLAAAVAEWLDRRTGVESG
jgi:alpha/beta superfamily hydrolase